MTKVEPPSHVLVTGASGFIAVWACNELLQQGFKVRGTVRSEEKGEYLRNVFGAFKERFSYIIVEDLEKTDAFDEAVKGVDGIAHIASPVRMNVTDPYQDLINPAVNGTLSLLRSAKKADNVKRIVITSSFAAVWSQKDTDYVFTEKDWNEHSPKVVEKEGKNTPPGVGYAASKVLAEKAAWKFVEDEKPAFDLVTFCPPYVFGPIIHQVKTAKSLNASVEYFYKFLIGESTAEEAQVPTGQLVDVRDLAIAITQAFVKEGAGGQRYAISKNTFTYQDLLDIVLADGQAGKNDWPKATRGTPGSGKNIKQNRYDATKSEKELGIKYRSLEVTAIDMSNSLKQRVKEWS